MDISYPPLAVGMCPEFSKISQMSKLIPPKNIQNFPRCLRSLLRTRKRDLLRIQMSSLVHEEDLQFWTNLQVQSSLFSIAPNFKAVEFPRSPPHARLFPTDFCQLDEHVRSARAGARLWLRANTGVTRELAPAGRLGDAGRFLDWNSAMSARVLHRSARGEGNVAGRAAPAPFRSGCPFPTRLPESGGHPNGEQQCWSGKQACGWRSANELAEFSLSEAGTADASAGGGRPGLSRRSRADRRELTCSRPTLEVGIRLATGEDFSRISSFYLSSHVSYSRLRQILRLFPLRFSEGPTLTGLLERCFFF